MEILILTCLLIVIVLLLSDKIVIKRGTKRIKQEDKSVTKLPDIMGLPKLVKRHSTPIKATRGLLEEKEEVPDNFETETHEKGFTRKIPQEELEEAFAFDELPDIIEEEEEWMERREPDDFGFAMGVTYEELGSVRTLLQKENLKPSEEIKAISIVQKIQGTEMFALLESSREDASQKIALLLEKHFSTDAESGSSTMRKNDLSDFDIGEFV